MVIFRVLTWKKSGSSSSAFIRASPVIKYHLFLSFFFIKKLLFFLFFFRGNLFFSRKSFLFDAKIFFIFRGNIFFRKNLFFLQKSLFFAEIFLFSQKSFYLTQKPFLFDAELIFLFWVARVTHSTHVSLQHIITSLCVISIEICIILTYYIFWSNYIVVMCWKRMGHKLLWYGRP